MKQQRQLPGAPSIEKIWRSPNGGFSIVEGVGAFGGMKTRCAG